MSAILTFLGSRLGGWTVAALVAAGLSLALYVQDLRLDAKDAELNARVNEILALNGQLDSFEDTNKRQAETIRQITDSAAAVKARADKAARNLAAALARTDEKTRTIIREIPREPSDNDPITAGERDLLVRLRDAYPSIPNGH